MCSIHRKGILSTQADPALKSRLCSEILEGNPLSNILNSTHKTLMTPYGGFSQRQAVPSPMVRRWSWVNNSTQPEKGEQGHR